MRIFLLPLLLGISFISTAQESGMLVAGINAFPAEQVVIGGKLACYRPLKSGHLYGIKLASETDALQAGPYDHRFFVSNLDLVRRWAIGRHDKTRLWFDTGLSVMHNTEIDPPDEPGTVFYCGVGATEADMVEMEEYAANWHIDKEFYPGVALAANLEFRLARYFYLGIDISANVYYSFEDKAVYTCPIPFISWSMPVWKNTKETRRKS